MGELPRDRVRCAASFSGDERAVFLRLCGVTTIDPERVAAVLRDTLAAATPATAGLNRTEVLFATAAARLWDLERAAPGTAKDR